jgi:hypothetical protein
VQVGAGEKDVDPRFLRAFEGLGGALDVSTLGTRKGRDDRPANLPGDRFYGGEIAVGRDGEAGFQNVHPEVGKGVGHLEFFVLRHAAARRLLAVTEGRIEKIYVVWGHLHPLQRKTLYR